MGVNKSIGNPTQNHAKPYDYNKNHECGDIPIDNPIRKHPKPMSKMMVKCPLIMIFATTKNLWL